MIRKAIQSACLDELAAMVGFSVRDADKGAISTLLLVTREGVMEWADPMKTDSPPALQFDPRWHRS